MTASLFERISDSISFIDKLLMCKSALKYCPLLEMADGLLKSIKDDGSVSYLIGTEGRYRTTPLATVIEMLSDVDMLPEDVLNVMQDKLYAYKDEFVPFNIVEDDVVAKNKEDMDAWSVDEGPSVWTTSKAVYTLIKTGYHKRCNNKRKAVISKAINWLVDQAYVLNDGASAWGFQHDTTLKDCEQSIPMSGLALKTIGIAYENREDIYKRKEFGHYEKYLNGIRYLKKELVSDGDKAYWMYDGKPSITATVWAIEAMETFEREEIESSIISQNDWKEIKKKALNWIMEDSFPLFKRGSSDTPSTDISQPFFGYTKTKYKVKEVKRTFYSFVPFHAAFLLKNGISPFHPKICGCIRWLLDNRTKNWAIDDYYSSEPCSFSAAMAINVIVVWLRKVNKNTYKNITSKIISDENFEDICRECEVYEYTQKGKIIKTNDEDNPEKTDHNKDNRVDIDNDIEEKMDDDKEDAIEATKKQKKSPIVSAIIFVLIGAITIIAGIYLLKDGVIDLLNSNDADKYIGGTLSVLGTTLIGCIMPSLIENLKNYFKNNDN